MLLTRVAFRSTLRVRTHVVGVQLSDNLLLYKLSWVCSSDSNAHPHVGLTCVGSNCRFDCFSVKSHARRMHADPLLPLLYLYHIMTLALTKAYLDRAQWMAFLLREVMIHLSRFPLETSFKFIAVFLDMHKQFNHVLHVQHTPEPATRNGASR